MSVAVLFESHEWSSFALEKNIRKLMPEIEVQLYDLETELELEAILAHDLIVSRIFASSFFRGHHRSLKMVQDILQRARDLDKPLLNSYEAHFYEIDKCLTAKVMTKHGLPVPHNYGCFAPKQGLEDIRPVYPCIIKPNCGGRTTDTHIIHTPHQLTELWPQLNSAINYLTEDYITPKQGFITRIEVIGGRCVQILKKTLAANGLAAYHLGSEFHPYPECPVAVQNLAVRTMALLNIEMGSLDIIEATDGPYIIDVNGVSNTSEDFVAEFGFDLTAETAKYIADRHKIIKEET